MPRHSGAALGLLLHLLIRSSLHAECMAIEPFIAAPEVVPPDPRLAFFWPRMYYPQTPKLDIRDGKWKPLDFTMERVGTSAAYDSYVLSIAAPEGAKVSVSGGTDDRKVNSSFRVDSSWAKPAAQAWEYRVRASTFAWPCSFERAQVLSVPAGPPAYRVEWRPKKGGRGGTLLVPAQSGRFFPGARPPAGERDEIKLGHLNCQGWNFRWDDPAVVLRLVGLYPDGSELPLPELRLAAPPRLGAGRLVSDLPDDLGSPYGAWRALVFAMQSGRPGLVRRASTRSGWADLKRTFGKDPARLAQAGAIWGDQPVRWQPNQKDRAEARLGPEIKEHSFRFLFEGGQWRLDGWSPGE